jgi:hypothetical protein
MRRELDGGFELHTADAQGLYAKLGFGEGVGPYPMMERLSLQDKQ